MSDLMASDSSASYERRAVRSVLEGVAVAAGRVGEDWGVGDVAGAEAGGGPVSEAEDTFAGPGFGGLADQSSTG
jgi:hypothetical protein